MTIPVFILFGGIDSASVLNEQKCIVQMGYMYMLHLYHGWSTCTLAGTLLYVKLLLGNELICMFGLILHIAINLITKHRYRIKGSKEQRNWLL